MTLRWSIVVAIGLFATVTALADEPSISPLDELLSEPISTASKYVQRAMQAPASVTVITAEEIERHEYETITEALASVRGLYLTNDLNYEYVGVRGFGVPSDYNNRLLVLIDGHPLNENFFGSAIVGGDLVLNMLDIERIEFVRGPGSVLYGTGALFGVVNIITRSADSDDPNNVTVSGGSAGYGAAAVRFGRVLRGGTNLAASATCTTSDGVDHRYAEYEGVAEDLDGERRCGVMGTVSRGGLTLAGYSSSRRKDVPTAAFETDFNAPFFTVDARHFLELRYARPSTDGSRLDLSVSWDQYAYRGEYWYGGEPNPDSTHGTWLTAEGRFLWNVAASHRLTIGGRVVRSLGAEYRAGGIALVPREEGKSTVRSIYVEDEYQAASNLAFVAGIRHDSGWKGRAATTPRLAVIFNPTNDGALKLLWGHALRAPSVYELFYDESAYRDTDQPLERESVRSLELAWEQRLSRNLLAAATLFENRVTDLIEPLFDETQALTLFRNTNEEVRARGLGLQLDRRTSRGVWMSASVVRQRAENEGELFINSPQTLARFRASSPLQSRFRVSGELAYESSRKTPAGTMTDPFLLTNLVLPTRVRPDLSPIFTVRNLFDVDYATPAGWSDTSRSSARRDGERR